MRYRNHAMRWIRRAFAAYARRSWSPLRATEGGRLQMSVLLDRCAVELCRQRGKCCRWTIPAQRVNRVEERNVRAQRRQIAKEERTVAVLRQRPCKRPGVRCVDTPCRWIVGNRFKVLELCQHGGRRLRAPPGQAWIAVGRVADEREIVGNRLRTDAELGNHARFVPDLARAADQLHNARAAHALREI